MSKVVTREEALQKAAQKLDISPSKYKQAMERFDSVKSYLLEGEYKGASGQPEIYLQGSFKLGTEIRPYKDSKDADYDIDIVCRLEHKKETTTPETVKHQVGEHLNANGTYKKMLDEEGKRCWTLNYAEQDGIGFHMDILPSVHERRNLFGGYSSYSSAIAVTNKCSDSGTYDWSTSNPKGFAEWFYDQNKTVFDNVKQDQKQHLFENYRQDGLFSAWDSVPDIHVKTPLQRAIQLLKRHRDIRFSHQKDEKYKPISMIITVLAAQIYNNETTIDEALKNLLNTLFRHANQMQPTFRFDEAMAQSTYTLITRTADGKWYIPNPTNHGENFADKWHEDNHARAKAFFQWVAWAKDDFVNIAEQLDEGHYIRGLVSPEEKAYGGAKADSSSLSVRSGTNFPSRFDVPHKQAIQFPIINTGSVSIRAFISRNGFRPIEIQSNSQTLPKQATIRFEAKTNINWPYKVYWQVVNTGHDAESASCLRGGFYEGEIKKGGKARTETTLYTGMHWVECFIVKDRKCVARSGEFIVNIG